MMKVTKKPQKKKRLTKAEYDAKFKLHWDAVKARFPEAKFVISVFDTIEEIDTKILTDRDEIIYADEYTVRLYGEKTGFVWKETERYHDYFIVRKREGQTHIRYCDVIDTMIENDFDRKTCTHKFMETIREASGSEFVRRNPKSIPIYASGWGS
jgi:hypothetical protein